MAQRYKKLGTGEINRQVPSKQFNNKQLTYVLFLSYSRLREERLLLSRD